MRKISILIFMIFSHAYAGCMGGGSTCICMTGQCASTLDYFESAVNLFDQAVRNKEMLGDDYSPSESIKFADDALKKSCSFELTTQDKKQLDYEFRQMGIDFSIFENLCKLGSFKTLLNEVSNFTN